MFEVRAEEGGAAEFRKIYAVPPVHSFPARHVLLGPLTVLTAVLLRPTGFVIRIVTAGAIF